jgi:D-alanine-D-alanine ligase
MSGGACGTVAVLTPALSESASLDDQDTLIEVETVSRALEELGYEAVSVPFSLDLERAAAALRELRPALVFNLIESVEGDGRLIFLAPALLEHLKLPYTGAPLDAMYLTSNKLLTKELLRTHGIPTPAWCVLPCAEPPWPGPFIVKSVWEDASIGLDDDAVVPDRDGLRRHYEHRRAQPGAPFFAEAYVEGRELAVSVVAGEAGLQALPIAEILFQGYPEGKPRIVGYPSKWVHDSFEFQNTPRSFDLPPADGPLLARLGEISKRCFELFGLRGYARVDFRVDASGEPFVLEVNPNPCISPDGGLAAAAQRAGLTLTDLVGRIVRGALPGPT